MKQKTHVVDGAQKPRWTVVAVFGERVYETTFDTLAKAAPALANHALNYPRDRQGAIPPAHRWVPSPDDGLDIVSVSEAFHGEGVARQSALRLSLLSPSGRRIPVSEALRMAENTRASWRRWRRRILESWNGEGPVPGISHGRYRWRRSAYSMVMADIRIALDDLDGAPPPRPSRTRGHLPDSWDRRPRSTSRSWKDQGRRGSQWDRNKSAGRHRQSPRHFEGEE